MGASSASSGAKSAARFIWSLEEDGRRGRKSGGTAVKEALESIFGLVADVAMWLNSRLVSAILTKSTCRS